MASGSSFAEQPEKHLDPTTLGLRPEQKRKSRRVENCEAFSTAIDPTIDIGPCPPKAVGSFALPTLRSLEARTTSSLHGPSDAAKSPLSGGRAQVAWKGLSGMDAARAALGHGWPVAAGPWNVTGAREPRRSRGRMQGQDFLLTFEGPAIRAFEKSEAPSRAKPNYQTARKRAQLAPPFQTPKRKRPRLGVVFSIRWADGNGFFSRHLVSVGGPDRRP